MPISIVVTQIAKLFLVLLLGVLLAKIGILDPHTKQHLTKLLLYVTTPLMMIDAFHDRMLMLEETPGNAPSVGRLFLVSFAFYAALMLLSLPLVWLIHAPKEDRRLYYFMTVFGNIGFMGFPIAEAVYGAEGLFYAAILNSVFNILIYTFGVVLMGAGQSGEGGFLSSLRLIHWRKLLLTPAVLCTAIGVVIFVCRLRLPALLADTFDSLGSLTSPLAMLVVGANLSDVRLREVFTDVRLDCYAALRQFILPVAMFAFMSLFVKEETLLGTLLLMALMPAANTTALFATEYHGNEALASKGIFLTTLFSLAAFPLILSLRPVLKI